MKFLVLLILPLLVCAVRVVAGETNVSATITNAVTVSTNETDSAFDLSSVSDRSVLRVLKELNKSPEWIWPPITSWSLNSETATTPYICAWKTAYCPFYLQGGMSIGLSLDTRESPRSVNPEKEEARVGIRFKFFGKKAKVAKR